MPVVVRLVIAWVAVVLATQGACYSANPAAGLPCSDASQCPTGQSCLPAGICVFEQARREFVHEAAADFTGDLVGMQVTKRGALEPLAWLTHGLSMRAVSRATFTDPSSAQWDGFAAEVTRAHAIATTTSVGWGAGNGPVGLGLATGTNITILLEGEIYLESGTWNFELRGDDSGFFDLAAPGTAEFRRIIAQSGTASATASETLPTKGWHPVRIAVSNANAAGSLLLRGAQGNAPVATFESTRLRTRVEDGTGLLQEVFSLPRLLRPTVARIAPSVTGVSFGAGVPPDSGLTNAGSYSVRYSGQFLVEGLLDGFTLSTTGGQRAWIDGRLVVDKLDAVGVTTSDIIDLGLSSGWHDIIVELHKNAAGDAAISVGAPKGDGTAFAAHKLRPVLGVEQRWLGTNNGTPQGIVAPPGVSRVITLADVPGIVTGGAYEVSIDHPGLVEVSATVTRGARVRTLITQGSLTGMGFFRARVDITDPSEYPSQPGGPWTFTVTDNLDPPAGNLNNASVTLLYQATSPQSAPFSNLAHYTSPPLDLGDVIWIGAVEVELERAGSSAVLSMRSGLTEEALLAAPWIEVRSGADTGLPPHRFVQYRFALTSSTIAAALQRFRLEYYTR